MYTAEHSRAHVTVASLPQVQQSSAWHRLYTRNDWGWPSSLQTVRQASAARSTLPRSQSPMIASGLAAGVATRWQVKPVHLLATEDGRATQQPAGNHAGFCNSLHSPQLFVGQPGMDAVCRHLIAGCITSWAHKVSKQDEGCQRWAWLWPRRIKCIYRASPPAGWAGCRS